VHSLVNEQLRVDVLDPNSDQHLLGPRFCWGGYIWQVHDQKVGPLLTGPEWPRTHPKPFNGQGLPESFRHRTRGGEAHTWSGPQGVAIGAGELALAADGAVTLVRPCGWSIEATSTDLVFRTEQIAAGYDYALVRSLRLTHRSLLSRSLLVNRGSNLLQLEWFAHPFFPLTEGLIEAQLPTDANLAANPGFALVAGKLSQTRRFTDELDGHMDSVQFPLNTPVTARVAHPLLTHVDFATSFLPSECLIWGNSVTFSIEPYQRLSLPPGAHKDWEVQYDFGYPQPR
jgi:hypothetical protein